MSIFKKALFVGVCYSLYKLLKENKYDEFRDAITNKYKELKPEIIDFLNNFDLYLNGATNVRSDSDTLELKLKIDNIKKQILEIDDKKIVKKAVEKSKRLMKIN